MFLGDLTGGSILHEVRIMTEIDRYNFQPKPELNFIDL
jgi:hypothetical protein